MPDYVDTLTEAGADANLEAHTSDSAHTYARVVGTLSMIVQGSSVKLLRGPTTAQDIIYVASWDPGGTDYSITASLTQKSATGGMMPGIRVSATTGDGYFFQRDPVGGNLKTFRRVGGVNTLVKTTAYAWGAGTKNINVAISGVGATVTIVVTDVTAGGAAIDTITDTDAARIVTGGRYGFYSGNTTFSTTTRIQISGMTGTNATATVAPANSVAPVISGVAAITQVLTVTNPGTWSPTGTITYQWLRDGSTTGMTGATSVSYTVTGSDAGHTLSCRVTETNVIGAGNAVSNGIDIPAAPVFSVLPAISPSSGPYHTLDVLTCSTGTASGSPTYARQWFRGASAITGETNSTYTLTVTDEAASITCHVTATNGGGSTTASTTPPVVPEVTAPLGDTSFLIYYSGGTGNSDPSLSIGGARGNTYPGTLSTLFPEILGSIAQSGATFYAVVYVRNTHVAATLASAAAYVVQQLAHAGLQIAVAVPTELAGVDVAPLANRTTGPSGVSWITSTDPAAGGAYGNLGPLAQRGLHVRLTITAGTTPVDTDAFDVGVQGTPA